jgi:hypothetical protein
LALEQPLLLLRCGSFSDFSFNQIADRIGVETDRDNTQNCRKTSIISQKVKAALIDRRFANGVMAPNAAKRQ